MRGKGLFIMGVGLALAAGLTSCVTGVVALRLFYELGLHPGVLCYSIVSILTGSIAASIVSDLLE